MSLLFAVPALDPSEQNFARWHAETKESVAAEVHNVEPIKFVELCGPNFKKDGLECLIVKPSARPLHAISRYDIHSNIFVAAVLLGAASLTYFAARNTWASSPETALALRASWGVQQLAALVCVACVTFGATGLAFRPERKIGRGHGEIDPSLYPRLDQHMTLMDVQPEKGRTYQEHFDAPVPKIIHQIWFGDQAKVAGQKELWSQYASSTGWEYKFWTEDEIGKAPLTEDNRKIIAFELSHKNFWSASDIARLEILSEHGGVYIDVDFALPKKSGHPIPLQSIMPMTHVTFMTETFARDVGAESGMFVCNGFIAASKHHPLIDYARSSVAKNWASTNRVKRAPAMYSTGPFFLNRLLRGAPHIIPFSEAEDLGMITW